MSDRKRKTKILVIEHEENIRQVLIDILKNNGHKVETADDGLRGVELFEEKEFDLVLTDLGMPEMSGWKVAEKIKSINGRVPVILITGWNIEMDETELRERWVDLVIHKPFEIDQVIKLVKEGIALRERFKAL